MCGRYASTRSAADLTTLFEAVDDTDPGEIQPRYNVAPTDPVPFVRISRQSATRVLSVGRWGLLPHWARDPRQAARMINARAETVATAPAYARAFATRRALVPADGWYEWRRLPAGGKQAYFMTPSDGGVLAFAGLWSRWTPTPGPADPGPVAQDAPATLAPALREAPTAPAFRDAPATLAPALRDAPATPGRLTFTVITVPARGQLTAVHDRMPLVLPPSRWRQWLVGGPPPLEPPPDALLAALEVRPVGPAVGNVHNDGPDLLTRIDPARSGEAAAPTLF